MAILRRIAFVIVFGLASKTAAPGQVDEYRVKAFFLYNFTRYVEWPSESFKSPNAPVVICILGQNPFGSSLDQAIGGKLVEGRSLAVRQIPDIQGGCNCQILFINAAQRKLFRSMVATLRGSAVLTVGETQGFTSDGGMVNFKLEGGKVHFEINVDAAAQERLRISSKLLSLAQIVRK